MPRLLTLLRRAAWAPLAVLMLHQVISRSSFRQPLDFAMHFSGGAAIAFFLFYTLACFENILGKLKPAGHYLFSFALACTVGLFWEFGELFSDVFFHTHIQKTIAETLRDLTADASGAVCSLLLVALTQRLRG